MTIKAYHIKGVKSSSASDQSHTDQSSCIEQQLPQLPRSVYNRFKPYHITSSHEKTFPKPHLLRLPELFLPWHPQVKVPKHSLSHPLCTHSHRQSCLGWVTGNNNITRSICGVWFHKCLLSYIPPGPKPSWEDHCCWKHLWRTLPNVAFLYTPH